MITPNSKPERYSNEKKTLIITFVSLNNIDEEFDKMGLNEDEVDDDYRAAVNRARKKKAKNYALGILGGGGAVLGLGDEFMVYMDGQQSSTRRRLPAGGLAWCCVGHDATEGVEASRRGLRKKK